MGISLYGLAAVLYTSTYFYYVPYSKVSIPVFFDFSSASDFRSPSDTVDFYSPLLRGGVGPLTIPGILDLSESPVMNLKKTILYSVSLELNLPRDQHNTYVGNFMVTLTAPRENSNDLLVIKRPAILPYKSQILEIVDTVAFLPLYVLSFWKQTSTITVPLAKNLPYSSFTSSIPPAQGSGELGPGINIGLDRVVNLASAVLHIHTQYRGLRAWMYHYRILLFIVGPCCIWVIECTAAMIVALFIVNLFGPAEKEPVPVQASLSRPSSSSPKLPLHRQERAPTAEREAELEVPESHEYDYPSPAPTPNAYPDSDTEIDQEMDNDDATTPQPVSPESRNSVMDDPAPATSAPTTPWHS